jgi:peptidoglycan/LPS O-acetylase OafA/YrhL
MMAAPEGANPYFAPTSWTESLLIGCGAAWVYRRGRQAPPAWLIRGILPVAAVATLVAGLWLDIPLATYTVFNVAALVVILAAEWSLTSNWIQTLLRARWLVAIGSLSYSLYLLHQPMIQLAIQIRGDSLAIRMTGAAVGVGFAIACALLVERPLRRFRDRPSTTIPSADMFRDVVRPTP